MGSKDGPTRGAAQGNGAFPGFAYCWRKGPRTGSVNAPPEPFDPRQAYRRPDPRGATLASRPTRGASASATRRYRRSARRRETRGPWLNLAFRSGAAGDEPFDPSVPPTPQPHPSRSPNPSTLKDRKVGVGPAGNSAKGPRSATQHGAFPRPGAGKLPILLALTAYTDFRMSSVVSSSRAGPWRRRSRRRSSRRSAGRWRSERIISSS